jgi:ABC-type uncharacterized transport system fused permease/ATPase subunit
MATHEADSKERKRTLWIVLVLIVLTAFGAWWFNRWLGQIDTFLAGGHKELAERQVAMVFTFFAVLLSVSLLGLAVMCAKHGLDVIKAGRFPSPQARLLGSMTVREGAAALMLGRLQILVALLLSAAAIVAMPWQVLRTLL